MQYAVIGPDSVILSNRWPISSVRTARESTLLNVMCTQIKLSSMPYVAVDPEIIASGPSYPLCRNANEAENEFLDTEVGA